MNISLIVAISQNNMIGSNNTIPWHLGTDLQIFKQRTIGHCILMGRKTYESIGRPLPKRSNLVLTSQKEINDPNVICFQALDSALEYARLTNESELFVIGGAEIYQLTLPICNTIYLTKVEANIDGDTLFPTLKIEEWNTEKEASYTKDEKNDYDFSIWIYQRK
jgi:dihydrofolate reductase